MDDARAGQETLLSVCLIVKNEEHNLAKCLASVKPVADEIVVVDTGSTDRTVQIARDFGARVEQFSWRQDFAAARNYAKSCARGKWVFQIDADEELFPQDREKLRDLVSRDECDVALVAIHNRSSSVFGENRPVVHFLARLFKNRPDLYYENPIHETLVLHGRVVATDINLLHHGYNADPVTLRNKRQRNVQLLLQRLAKCPDDLMACFYLSSHYLGVGDFDAARIYAQRVVSGINRSGSNQQHVLLMALNNIAIAELEKGNYARVEEVAKQAEKLDADYLVPQFFLGLSYFRQGRYPEAKKVFEAYLQRHKDPQENVPAKLYDHASHAYLFQVCHLLGKIYRREKAFDQAREMLIRAVELNPQFWIALAELGYLCVELKDLARASEHFEKAIAIARANPAAGQKNQMLRQDLVNLVKSYLVLLKRKTPDAAGENAGNEG